MSALRDHDDVDRGTVTVSRKLPCTLTHCYK